MDQRGKVVAASVLGVVLLSALEASGASHPSTATPLPAQARQGAPDSSSMAPSAVVKDVDQQAKVVENSINSSVDNKYGYKVSASEVGSPQFQAALAAARSIYNTNFPLADINMWNAAQDLSHGYAENQNQYFSGLQNSFPVDSSDGLLYRGANPGGSNDAVHLWTPENLVLGLQSLKDQGITTDVDFEDPKDPDKRMASKVAAESATCQALGMKFVSIPMSHNGPSQGQVAQFLETILVAKLHENGGKIYCHCREGRDRTGYMVAEAEEHLFNVSPADAKAEDIARGHENLWTGLEVSGTAQLPVFPPHSPIPPPPGQSNSGSLLRP